MADKKIFIDYDFNKQSVKNVKLNPISTAARNALSLNAGDEGIVVWDTDENQLYGWDGNSWEYVVSPAVIGGYLGAVAHNATAPSASVGNYVIFTSAGTATNFGGGTVESGDMAVYNGSSWDLIQGNTVDATTGTKGIVELATNAETQGLSASNVVVTPSNLGALSASESQKGIAEIATQSETNTGTDDVTIVSPLKLATWATQSGKAITRQYTVTITTLTANTPSTVTHNLTLSNAWACQVACYQSLEDITSGLDIVVVDADNLTIESNVTLSNVRVVVTGY